MYKILLVDDDRLIRRSLATTIPWKRYGYELVGEASNGEEGLSLIDQHKPQIVISDIKMPFMDGLQMASIGKTRYPEMKVILLTGYEDFKFAQEAIKIKAFDYLLKPVESSILLKKVQQAAMEWEYEQRSQMQKVKGIRFLKQKWLKKLLHQRHHSLEIYNEMEKFNVYLKGECVAVSIIRLEDIPKEGQLDEERLDHAYKICSQAIENQGEVFDWEENEFIVILSGHSKEEILKEMKKLIEQICLDIEAELGIRATAAAGEVHNTTSIALSYFQAREVLKSQRVVAQKQIGYRPHEDYGSVVDKAIEYMEQHYNKEGLTLNEVAQAVHVNPSYLSNMFKVKKGTNFSDCLLELRMRKAMELLRDRNAKVYEVAEMVGYSNPQYFSVCFKKYVGLSPLDFKKSG
ncbi:putative response regulatory protein [Geobacillus thermodenitrificans]|jgi:two-component system response regulator YesN|uniref:response regulator n=1 Tax=Geobacillus TaxID=129337 RepID=UPI0006E67001|nr:MULTISPECIES: response regulator [Geobacillus]ARP42956.1 putative response regulatory protein [Geobacillus thermodenitrificans]KQB94499.1 hypothetical protein GEPA3_0508 [Geobacillus sp. PA-3]